MMMIISLDAKPLKLVDKFIYIGYNISSTESNGNVRTDKALSAIDKLWTIYKSVFFFSGAMKYELFQLCQYYSMVALLEL